MKKNYLLLLTLLAVSTGLSAQTSNTNVNKKSGDATASETINGKWTIGVDVGATVTNHDASTAYMKTYSYVPQLGTSFGVDVRYQPYKWLAFRTGIHRIAKNYAFVQVDSININNVIEVAGRGELAKNWYLDVPFMADLSIGNKVRYHLFLGGYVGYWYGGSRNGNAQPLMTDRAMYLYDESYTFDKARDNRFEAGLAYGLGLSIPCSAHFGIDVNMHMYYGLTDTQKNNTRQHIPHYNTTFLLQVGATYTL